MFFSSIENSISNFISRTKKIMFDVTLAIKKKLDKVISDLGSVDIYFSHK